VICVGASDGGRNGGGVESFRSQQDVGACLSRIRSGKFAAGLGLPLCACPALALALPGLPPCTGAFGEAPGVTCVLTGSGGTTPQIISLSADQMSITVGGTAYLTTSGYLGGGAIVFNVISGVCSLSGRYVTGQGAGTCVISAAIAADSTYTSASTDPGGNVQITVTAAPAPTVSSISPAQGSVLGGDTVTISGSGFATTPANNIVTFGSAAATVTAASATSLTVTAPAKAAADTSPVDVTVTVGGQTSAVVAGDRFAYVNANQTISFTSSAPQSPAVGGTYTPTASGGGSGNAVVFSIDSASGAVCTISTGTVTFNAVGTCTISADQAGNANYAAAPRMQQSISVSTQLQSAATLNSTTSMANDGTISIKFTLANTGNADLAVLVFNISGQARRFFDMKDCNAMLSRISAAQHGRLGSSQSDACVMSGKPDGTLGSLDVLVVLAGADGVSNAVGVVTFRDTIQLNTFSQVIAGATKSAQIEVAKNASAIFYWSSVLNSGRSIDVVGGGFAPGLAFNDDRFSGSLFGEGADDPAPALQPSPPIPTGRPSQAHGPISLPGFDLPGAPASAGGQFNPFRLTGQIEDGQGTAEFFTSLSMMRQAAAAKPAAMEKDASGGMGLKAGGKMPAPTFTPMPFNAWLDLRDSYFIDTSSGTKFTGNGQVLTSGVDYKFNPAVIGGVMAEADWLHDSADATGAAGTVHGWMAGPYLAVKVTPNVTLGARASWGTSSTDLTPFGTFTDTYGSTRSLYAASVTGNWKMGAWRFIPEASVLHFSQISNGYTDALGVYIDGQQQGLGRATAGPRVSYSYQSRDGTRIEPSAGLAAVYDFDVTGLPANAQATGANGLRGKADLGLGVTLPNGFNFSGNGTYDGIGDSTFHSVTGGMRLTMPFN